MDDFDVGLGLEGTHVVITGGSGMIGGVVASAFLAAGCRVTILDLKPTQLIHDNLLFQNLDVTDENATQHAFDAARARFGQINVLVAAAGKDLSFLEHHDSNTDMSVAQFQATVNVNVTGTFITCREWLRGLVHSYNRSSRNNSLIVFGSEAGLYGVDNSDYAASKAALHGLVMSFAPDAARYGARVNLIAPGPVATPQFRKEIAEDPSARWKETATSITGQPVPMEAVARTCLFLASDRYSGSITGQTHRVDGGKTARLASGLDCAPSTGSRKSPDS